MCKTRSIYPHINNTSFDSHAWNHNVIEIKRSLVSGSDVLILKGILTNTRIRLIKRLYTFS